MSDRYEALRVVRYNLAHGGLSVADDGYLVSYDYYAITEARLKRVIEERDVGTALRSSQRDARRTRRAGGGVERCEHIGETEPNFDKWSKNNEQVP